FRVNPAANVSFQWNSPAANVRADYSALVTALGGGDDRGGSGGAGRCAVAAAGRGASPNALQQRSFKTMSEYVLATRQDQHSVAVDYDVFVNVPRVDAKDLRSVQKLYKAEDLDFRLKPGSAAVDRGTPLANVTDG